MDAPLLEQLRLLSTLRWSRDLALHNRANTLWTAVQKGIRLGEAHFPTPLEPHYWRLRLCRVWSELYMLAQTLHDDAILAALSIVVTGALHAVGWLPAHQAALEAAAERQAALERSLAQMTALVQQASGVVDDARATLAQ